VRLDESECRERFGAARRVVLGTCGADRQPHLVPVTFALVGDVVVSAVDHKPKTTTRLRRLANIVENPSVSLLLDHYEDDWDRLWWVRADARATVVADGPQWSQAIAWLVARYPAYAARPPTGPVVRAEVTRWSGWASGPRT
jgi:PPOX class probable F420-dependent enzyme